MTTSLIDPSDNQEKLCITALEGLFSTLITQLDQLPFDSREIFIETCCSILLDNLVPMSGITIQQHIPIDTKHLVKFHDLIQKNNISKKVADAHYVYKYPREATSAGILPAYRDNKTGDIYIVLICNKRNLTMYNWSAGYSEVYPPPWKNRYKNQEIYFDREKVLNIAKKFMLKTLEQVDHDWTKVIYDYALLEKEFQTENMPAIDFNSLHTAVREGNEEINLDLTQFPDKKSMLIHYDNTLGISQSDAPGQMNNRSHQYLVYLGSLDKAPDIGPGDDVAIAEWVKVSDIMRASSIEYCAGGKPLSIYMLRGLELGLKQLWSHLIEEASTLKLPGKIARFSNGENLLAEIYFICQQYHIQIDENLKLYLDYLAGHLPGKTLTGKTAQYVLNCTLQIANYLTNPVSSKDTFLSELNKILFNFEMSA